MANLDRFSATISSDPIPSISMAALKLMLQYRVTSGCGMTTDGLNVLIALKEDANDEKRNRRLAQGRPYLLRRSTMGNTGSFKRRSLKLRRSHRERRDPDSEC